jgi:hypothetical protein
MYVERESITFGHVVVMTRQTSAVQGLPLFRVSESGLYLVDSCSTSYMGNWSIARHRITQTHKKRIILCPKGIRAHDLSAHEVEDSKYMLQTAQSLWSASVELGHLLLRMQTCLSSEAKCETLTNCKCSGTNESLFSCRRIVTLYQHRKKGER